MIAYIFASIFATPFSSDIGTRFAIFYFCNLFQDTIRIKVSVKRSYFQIQDQSFQFSM